MRRNVNNVFTNNIIWKKKMVFSIFRGYKVSFYIFLSRKPVSVRKNTGNRWTHFLGMFEKFRTWDRDNLEHFSVVAIIHSDPGSIVQFYEFVFARNIVEQRVNWFSWHYRGVSEWHKQWLTRLFHTWLYCFTVCHLGAAVGLFAISRKNEWIDFHDIFMIERLWH